MDKKGIGRTVLDEFSGLQAKKIIAEISKYHRIAASPGMTEAAHYVRSVAQQVGLVEVELKEYDVDGHSKWWTWKTPWYWTSRAAELRVVAPQKVLLARFPDIPCSLAVFSGSTPAEGIKAEVVDVGRGLKNEDYEGKDVKGKIVLLSGPQLRTSYASKLAQEKEALGIITDYIIEIPPTRTRVDDPEIVGYNRVRVEDDGSSLLGFSINHKQMLLLKNLLTKGPVHVHAQVDTELRAGTLPVVTGVIKGSTNPEEEVVFVAHLCHPSPSANDNASGCALLLELARALTELIKRGEISTPKRTLRFLWLPEFLGTLAYLHENEAWTQQVKAVLCTDMVGEDQIKCGGPLVVEKTPDSLPSFLNDLVEHFLEIIPSEGKMYSGIGAPSLWKYSVEPFGGGSDHAPFMDPSFAIPSVLFVHWPDRFWHTSDDTIDKVDPQELEKVAWVVSEVAFAVVNADRFDAELFAKETFSRGLHRLHQKSNETIWQLKKVVESPETTDNEEKSRIERIGEHAKKGIQVLKFRQEVEQNALESVLSLVAEPDWPIVRTNVKGLQEELEQETQQLIEGVLGFTEKLGGMEARAEALKETPISEEMREHQSLIPLRKWKGPLNFGVIEDILGWERTRWLQERMIDDRGLSTMLHLAILWVDGTRTLWDIAQRVRLSADIEVDLKTLQRYFEDLQDAGLIEFKKREA